MRRLIKGAWKARACVVLVGMSLPCEVWRVSAMASQPYGHSNPPQMSLPAQNRSSTTWAFHPPLRNAPVTPPTPQMRHIHPQQPPHRQHANHLSWQTSRSLRTLHSKMTSLKPGPPLTSSNGSLLLTPQSRSWPMKFYAFSKPARSPHNN